MTYIFWQLFYSEEKPIKALTRKLIGPGIEPGPDGWELTALTLPARYRSSLLGICFVIGIEGCSKYESHPESKERLRIQSARLFCCSRSWVQVFSVMLKIDSFSCTSDLVTCKCRDSCGHGCADWEVWGVIRFLQADEILGYLAEEARSRVELFCCTTMHVRILPGRHKPCCVSNYIGTSSSILRTVRTWHRRTFSCFQKMKEHLGGKRFSNDEDLKDAGWIIRWSHGMKKVYTNWCQGTASALISKAIMWKIR